MRVARTATRVRELAERMREVVSAVHPGWLWVEVSDIGRGLERRAGERRRKAC